MLSVNFKPKRTASASRGFFATARLSCTYFVADDARLWMTVFFRTVEFADELSCR